MAKCWGCQTGQAVRGGIYCVKCLRAMAAGEGLEDHVHDPIVKTKRGRRLPLALVFLAAAIPAKAQQAVPDPNADPIRITAGAGALVTMGADSDTQVGPSALIDVDAPLAIGSKAWARVRTGIELTTAPGQTTPDLTNAQSFKAVAFRASIARAIGAYDLGNKQWIRTLIVAEASFSTRLPTDPPPLDRVIHSWGAGIGIEDSDGNGIQAVVGRNQAADGVNAEAVPPTAPGFVSYHTTGVQMTIRGQVKVPLTNDYVILRGDAVINMILPDDPGIRRRDVVRVGICVNLAKALSHP
jgi:hypothetical protein